jgi:hypothetical protein
MIRLIDYETGHDYDLPSKFKLSIEKVNPFLSKEGSTSLSISLPPTDINFNVLGYPYRTDRQYKYLPKRKIIINAGLYQRPATLQVTSASRNMITATCLFGESIFYSQMNEVTMPKVFSNVVRDDFNLPYNPKILAWLNYFEKVMMGDEVDDFFVFTVCTKMESRTITLPAAGEIASSSFTYTKYYLLNAPLIDLNHLIYDENSNPYFPLIAKSVQTDTIDNITADYPIGYNVTPFLKLSYVLTHLFQYFGYTLNQDYLTKYPDLQKEVVLNNTCDSIMTGVLHYEHLVPTGTVNDFLDGIRKRYGCDFFLSDNGLDVKVIFISELIDSIDSDLTKNISVEPVNNIESFKSLKLSCNHSLDQVTSNFATYQKLVENKTIIPMEYLIFSATTTLANGYYFSQNLCTVFQVKDGKMTTVGDDSLDYYDEITDLTAQEMTSPHTAVPLVYADLMIIPSNVGSRWKGWYYQVPFIGDKRMLNTSIRVEDDLLADTSNSSAVCPIMFCFFHGQGVPNPNETTDAKKLYSKKLAFASTHSYNNIGQPNGNLHMVYGGEKGLFETFWKKFNDVLNNSYQPILTNFNLSVVQFQNFDIAQQKLVEGQPVIVENMKYEISDTGIKMIEANLRTTKLYE